MPKPPTHALIWSTKKRCYILHTPDHPPQPIIPGNEEIWRVWLTTHSSFSFQGQHGRLNVLKEFRARGTGYWYAYHTNSGSRRKCYLGPSVSVTLARLEEVAEALQEIKREHTTQAGNETPSNMVEPERELNDQSRMMVMTRLFPPRLPATLVVRERLLSVMDTALSRPLTLLSASAGWGKTTLLSAWAHRHPQSVAWLSLEELDNDPTRFWISLIVALRRWWPEIGERALALLPGRSLSAGVTMLLSELVDRSAQPSPIVLILDDYHVIDEPTIHASLSIFLKHLPSHVHLILSSRVDPDLPLSRFRVRGQLFELRDTDLRFTREEAQHFLIERMGLALEDRDVALLEAHTEGWIASLQLAALFLQKQTDPSAGVRMLRGNQRFLLDYLREEILASLSQDVQDFLLETSGLNPLSTSLCDAVRGREDSDHLLEQVERANLFLQPLSESRQWYRYHALWAQGMQHEARLRLGAAALHSLSQKASLWYEQQRMLPEAIEAALAGEDFGRVALLIERFVAPNSFRNEFYLLRSWLEQLPEEVVRAQPELCSLSVLAMMFTTDRRSPAIQARSEQFLLWAEQGFEAKGQWEHLGDALELHAELAFYQEDFPRALVLAYQARPLLSKASFLSPDNVLADALEAFLTGEVERAWPYILESLERSKRIDSLVNVFATLLYLGNVCLEKGEMQKASRYYHQALSSIDQDQEMSRQQFLATGDMDPFFTSWAYHSLAQISYEQNDISKAQHYLSQALALREKPEESIHVFTSGSLIQTRLLQACGETAQAQELLLRWERSARFSWPLSMIRVFLARVQLAQGNLLAVEQWAQHTFDPRIPKQEQDLPLLYQQEEALLLARLQIAQKRGEAALNELAPWKEKAQAQGRKRSVLEIQILVSLAHFVSQESTRARSALREALELAQPENYQRLFLDEGPEMEHLLKMLLPELREASLRASVQNLLRAFAQDPGSQPAEEAPHSSKDALFPEPLSNQEQRVLRLLVAGRSNPEIARQLVISVNTVKTHVQSLYRKLDVNNRVEASEVARRLLLL
ncbi:LuxR C-terminal-related transcriptional regulator [Ktedonobacter robiniae]|uniref:LuxR family transcriptional regulator n=1 Tax=Ktedonobacter robiniae TaxID=2778365 RepID=A0ABQ3UY59_9CHLR|nr:LuxR C-terminal-related transcriptional regulator [Ktedonobacter robiniae]GHO57482.1 LuxR family transcriptional regulator [Ktedonobacter robiniae]